MIDTTNIDSILVTTYQGVKQDDLGDFLADQVDLGKNVVITLFANCLNYKAPLGRFETPLTP